MRRFEVGCQTATLVTADGVRLAVQRSGVGVPVVCLAAIGHGGRDFEAFAEALPPGFEVIRIDWPGQGRSDPDPRPVSARRYADLLGEVLTRLRIERPILVGNSIGGAAAILHADRAPVRGLVLCDPGGLVAVDATVRRFCGAFARFFAAGERGAAWFKPAFALYYRMVLPQAAAREQRRRIVASAYEIAPVLRQAWRSFGEPEADIRHVAARLEAPTWFAWGAQDRVIPLSRCRPAISAMKRASLSQFQAGHAAFLEQPAAFTRDFLAFAEGLREAAPASAA